MYFYSQRHLYSYDWLEVANCFVLRVLRSCGSVSLISRASEDSGRELHRTSRNLPPDLRKTLLILEPEKNRMAFVHDGNYASLRLHPALKDKEVHLALKDSSVNDPLESVSLRYLNHHDRTQPPTLMELCRRVIRRGCNREDEKIEKLAIPKQFVKYLLR